MADSPKQNSTAAGASAAVNPATGKAPRWKMALDIERCIGCHACSVACKVENNMPLGGFRTKVYYLDEGKFPKVKRSFLPTLCMQCDDAPCLRSCPIKAIS
jgi:tetrathionate reductase subunit B